MTNGRHPAVDPTDQLERAARDRGVAGMVESNAGPRVATVPESNVHDTFAVDGIETRRREALLETMLAAGPAISAASATARNGTVGIHHDPSVSREQLRDTLTSYGLLVEPGDEAFASRRAAQFDSARLAVAVLFGLLVAVPYIGVLYPTRIEWLFYDPVTVAYLQTLLDSRVATHFYVNLAALSGIAFIVACGPTIRRAMAALSSGRVSGDVAFVGGVVALYGYSTLAAFTGFGGAVHYDLVAYATIGAVCWSRYTADVATPTTDDEAVVLTDGGR